MSKRSIDHLLKVEPNTWGPDERWAIQVALREARALLKLADTLDHDNTESDSDVVAFCALVESLLKPKLYSPSP